MWRICSGYHTAFSLYGGAYYAVEMFRFNKRKQKPIDSAVTDEHGTELRSNSSDSIDMESQHPIQQTTVVRRRPGLPFFGRARAWRNLSENQDPQMEVPLRIVIPITITCFIYVLCRFYIYLEDLISLRAQPADVYLTVNNFFPFLPAA